MKKSLMLLLSVIVMLTMLSACSGNTNGKNEPAGDDGEIKGDLVFLTNRTDMIGNVYDEYKKRFEEKYPGVNLEFEEILDYDATFKVRMSYVDVRFVVILQTV